MNKWLIAITAVGGWLWFLGRKRFQNLDQLPYADLIDSAAEKHQVDPKLIASIIKIESGFKAQSIGDNGTSFGLMQVNCTPILTGAIGTARVMGFKGDCRELLNPAIGIDIGTAYLARQLNRYGADGVVAYNTGYPYHADGSLKTGTNNYAQRVMNFYRSL
jgi:soluble lytic murein transglycosylase-like protein